MEKSILSIFTRTPLHIGAGNSVGAIDSPVMRERHTRFPVIPGSSLKGVMSSLWASAGKDNKRDGDLQKLFGSDDDKNPSAGALLIGEGRLLAFPVRSAKGAFAWLTCPLALERYKRDSNATYEVPKIADDEKCLVGDGSIVLLGDKVVLEEYCLTISGQHSLKNEFNALSSDEVWKDWAKRLVVVSDELFSYFVENACEVVTRICIDDETGTVKHGALFNQEQIPSETLFYSVIASQGKSGIDATTVLKKLKDKLADPSIGNILQIGGHETIGLGYCSVSVNDSRRA
jgi:CRISPR-associated protein Cmr4